MAVYDPNQQPNPQKPLQPGQPVMNTLTAPPGGPQTVAGGPPAPPQQPLRPQQPAAQPAPPQSPPSVQGFQQWAQQTFGRQATPQELQQIAQQVGYAGGAITPQQFQQAQQVATEMARAMGWRGNTPAAPIDPFQQANIPTAPTSPELAPVNQSPLQQQLSQQLSQWLAQQPGANLQNDPAFQAQTNAFNVASQRGADRQRAALAEAAGTQGLSRGALNNILERQAEGEQGFAAQLAGQRIQQQQEQMMQAAQLAASIGNQDLASQLQQRAQALQQAGLNQSGFGMQLQALMQQRGMDLQRQLGLGDLDLRRILGMGQLQLGNRQLDVQNQQANNRLGFDYAQLQALMNRSALMDILGGL